MISCEEIILKARDMKCSDIHISAGLDMIFRINGALTVAPFDLTEDETHQMLMDTLDEKQRDWFDAGNDVDFAIQTCDGNRQRVNIFRQMTHTCATIRLLNNKIPSLEELHLPQVIHELADKPRGMILVTGPTGSGKSTTLAAMIDHINSTRAEHIITIEDPVEYVYEKKKSLIHQREVGRDVTSFQAALRSALREDPDIILVGEMRDYETIEAALMAAETGHLVMSTLHTNGAAQTVDRIIDACPAEAQNQVRSQLGGILQGIITQTLIPNTTGKGRVPGTEILVGTDAALNLIRENKSFQLGTVMQSGASQGMHTLNACLADLVYKGMISPENAFKYSNNRKDLEQFLGPMMF